MDEALVLDTSFLVAFYNRDDVHHEAAVPVMERFLTGDLGTGLLLEYVFMEVVTVLHAKLGLAEAVRVGELLLAARELTFVPCSDRFLATLETFRAQSDRGLSFADAAIVTMARLHPPGRVATFDRALGAVDGVKPIPV